MAGSREQALKAVQTKRERYDAQYVAEGGYFAHLGRSGAKVSNARPDRAKQAAGIASMGGRAKRAGREVYCRPCNAYVSAAHAERVHGEAKQ